LGFAVHEGKWLLVGGRTNGFHRTSIPESTFPSRFANEYLYVVDPGRNASWKVALPEKYRFELRATNAEFYQDGPVLYVVGGYGSKTDADADGDYQTFPTLTAIRVPEVVAAIIGNKFDQIESAITSVTDDRMRVTGGGLQKLDDTFYLVFGQNYDKKYKGAVTGKYTDEVRRFKIRLTDTGPSISDYEAISDPMGRGAQSEYHRRDLNVAAAVRPDGRLGISAYGGVFTKSGEAWRRPVYIDQNAAGKATVAVDAKFEQKMCQYDAARVLMFDPVSKTMYTTILGGITLFYYNEDGQLEKSNLNNFMPFTRAITTLARGPDGATVETPQSAGDGLPVYVGADAAFLPLHTLPRATKTADVLDYSKLPAGAKVLVGHLYGGIRSSAQQVNGFNPSFASSTIYEVYVERK